MHLKKQRYSKRKKARQKERPGRKEEKEIFSFLSAANWLLFRLACLVHLSLVMLHWPCNISPVRSLANTPFGRTSRHLLRHQVGASFQRCFRVDLYYCIIVFFSVFLGLSFYRLFFCFYFLGHRFATVLCFAVADLSLFFFLSLYRRFLCPGHRLSLNSFPWLCSVSWSSLCCCFPFGGRQIFRLIIYIFPCYVVFVTFFYHFILLILILFRDRHFVSIFIFYCISFYLVFLESFIYILYTPLLPFHISKPGDLLF